MKKVVVLVDQPSLVQFIAQVLERRPGLQVETASSASELEARSEGQTVILTNLPGDCLEFLSAAPESDAPETTCTAVVVLTSQQNEHLAVEAIRKGAVSYVPIRLIDVELPKTLDTVFSALHARDNRIRILECLTRWRIDFVLENDRSLIGPLVRYLQESTQRLGMFRQSGEETRMGIALEEALLNSMHHGNLEVPSLLREDDDTKFYDMIKARRNQVPYCDRRVMVHAELSRDEAKFIIRDEGPGFDVSKIPDPTDPNNVECVSGRGMLLMRTFMDQVEYNEVGNVVTLIKRRQLRESE